MKKTIALILSLMLLLSLAAPAFADAGSDAASRGFAYLWGEGEKQDYVKAREFFLQAADTGNADVLYQLGDIYEYGLGVNKNMVEAVNWYVKAADAGSADAREKLSGEPIRSIAESLTVQEQSTTAESAGSDQQGAAAGAVSVGLAYYKGDGVPQNYAKALGFFLQEAQAGSTDNLYYIGEIYELGTAGPRNPVEATFWYLKASDAGDSRAKDKLKVEPMKSIAEALSTQKQATHASGSYGEREQIYGYMTPFYLDHPLANVDDLTIVVYLKEWTGGWPYGNFGVFVRDRSGIWRMASLLPIDKSLGVGQAMTAHLKLDYGDDITAVSLCPVDNGVDYSAVFETYYIVSQDDFSSYSPSNPKPTFNASATDADVSSKSFEMPEYGKDSGPQLRININSCGGGMSDCGVQSFINSVSKR